MLQAGAGGLAPQAATDSDSEAESQWSNLGRTGTPTSESQFEPHVAASGYVEVQPVDDGDSDKPERQRTRSPKR